MVPEVSYFLWLAPVISQSTSLIGCTSFEEFVFIYLFWLIWFDSNHPFSLLE